MRFKGAERSSILLLSRSTVIVGAIVIIILSFGIGYFWGYKGSGISQTGEEPKKDAEQKLPLPPEDKRVLETTSTTPKESPIAPSIKPPEFPSETTTQKPPEPETGDKKQKTEDRRQMTDDRRQMTEDRTQKTEERQQSADDKGKIADSLSPNNQSPDTSQIVSRAKHKGQPNSSAKPFVKASKTGAATSKKLYTVQFGAFPNKEGAEQLRQSLNAKGIKAYIVSKTEGDPYFRVRVGTYKNKREADIAAVSMKKKTGMQNFVTTK